MTVRPGTIAAHVDAERLWRRHMELAQHGATPNGGVDRQALSAEEIAARRTIVAWGEAIGLSASNDDAGNLFLRLAGTAPDLPPVMIGSHIDSQPTGGKFDGAFGVLAALESVEAIVASGARPRRPIDVVAWMNEEGSRFAPGMMGSAAFTGARKLADVLAVRDAAGVSVSDALAAVLAAEPQLPGRPLGTLVAAFVEAHIEQGPILEAEKRTIGVVTGIQGKRTFRVTVTGEENHAGTSPRSARRDALVSAVAMVHALQAAMWDAADVVRFTIGRFEVTPNAPSVVPARVVFSIDLRHPDTATLRDLGDRIPGLCAAAAGRCVVEVRELLHDPPLAFPAAIRDRIRAAAQDLGITWMDIPSGAGHDARYLHYHGPTGMIFIPCKDGLSHHEAESATRDDIAAGARVLAETAFGLSVAE
ncbi:Zn-dependent hydrolase [Rhodoplanes elegans]|uniref:Zn-dependent hydrolase n=1 Tax=Rhodoplanes elegans TaxID=29408 RepID=A0A327KLG0_9BRAD|nr:M20 family metallo-hydrolase [Rhodoplanes elegans]MBK5957348.1 Zn-dependent hydrolase [Rhodoplanes elegans]RAI38864.1 Zn-dependent hydrolase [Rhodoplanes elegans]